MSVQAVQCRWDTGPLLEPAFGWRSVYNGPLAQDDSVRNRTRSQATVEQVRAATHRTYSVALGWNLLIGLLFPLMLLRWGLLPDDAIGVDDLRMPEQAPAFMVNINQATVAELRALPEIGPAIAERIVTYRQQNGNFQRLEELQAVPGLGPKTLERVRSMLTTSSPTETSPSINGP